MNSHLSRDNSQDEPKRTVEHKLDDFEMVKTIGTGMTSGQGGSTEPYKHLLFHQ